VKITKSGHRAPPTETGQGKAARGTPVSADAAAADLQVVPGRQRLGDQLYGQILDYIVEGHLKEGDRLPTENEICDMFGVSRPVVREALMRLRADGLIQSRQGAGTFVHNRPTSRLTSFASASDVASYLRCIEVRMPLEGAAARLAAERRTPDQMRRIENAHRKFEEAIADKAASLDADLAFHEAVIDATGNEFFLAMLRSLNEAMSGFMRLTLNLTRTGPKDRARQVLEEHARIVEAIRDQDGESASVAMRFHIGQAKRRLIDGKRDL
jgi:GntR family transcriptional regulator, transcriptional repressor for pyruvate dehydrogenase complex